MADQPALFHTWAPLFPDHYKGYTTPQLAAIDIACFARLDAGESFVVSLHGLGEGRPTRIALYKRDDKIELSRAMPMLEDLGLRVIEAISARSRQAQQKTQAPARSADARGPGAARDREHLDPPARRRRDVGAGVPRARTRRAAARARRRRRPGGGG